MKNKKVTSNAWRLALVMVGTVIGAGFASGAEITAYFTRYGEAGLWSTGLMGMLFFLGIYGTLKIAYEHGNKEFGTFTETIAGKWAGAVMDAMVTFSMLLGYGVMLAGSDAVFLQQFDLPSPVGALGMAGCSAAALCFGARGVVGINRILTPILIIGILLVSVYGICTSPTIMETVGISAQPVSILTAQPLENIAQAMGSAALYASYNILGASAVLVSLADYINRKQEAVRVAAYTAIILMVLTGVLGLATFLNYDTIVNIPIPILELLRDHEFWQRAYMLVLLGAMYTTAVSDGFGFMSRIQAIWPIKNGSLWLLMTVMALLMSRIGFTNLVNKGYRILGYVGILQLLLIAARCILEKEKINGKQKRRNQR